MEKTPEPKKPRLKSTNLRWDPEKYEELKKAAENEGINSVAVFIRYIMTRFLKQGKS